MTPSSSSLILVGNPLVQFSKQVSCSMQKVSEQVNVYTENGHPIDPNKEKTAATLYK